MIELRDERRAMPAVQGAMLCCIRLCVMAMRRGTEVEPDAGRVLDLIGAPSALPHLTAFMAELSRGSTRMIEVRCTCKSQIAADEQALLDVLSLAQAVRPFEALLMLRGFVTAESARMALQKAEHIGDALAQAGRFLPVPDRALSQYALSSGTTPLVGLAAHSTLDY